MSPLRRDDQIEGNKLRAAGSYRGFLLRQAREQQRLSLEAAAEYLRLPVSAVRALEENDPVNSPPSMFVRGFLRTYSRWLRLPEQEVLASFPPLEIVPSPDQLRGDHRTSPRKPSTLAFWIGLSAVSAVTAILFLRYHDWLAEESGWLAPKIVSKATESAIPVQVPAPIPPEAEFAAAPKPPVEREAYAVDPPEPPPLTSDPPDLANPPPSAAVPDSENPSMGPPVSVVAPVLENASTSDALVLKFVGESWATVIDASGRRLLYEAGQPGTTKTVSGKFPLRVNLGRPGNVQIEFHGQPYGRHFEPGAGPARLKIGEPKGD